MKAKIAMYKNHDRAVQALLELSKKGFPMDHVSLMGDSKVIDNHVHIIPLFWLKELPVFLGIVATTIIGALEGMKTIDLNGLHILYGSGGFVGAIAGFYAGLIIGGISWIIVSTLIRKDRLVKLNERLKYGKFFLLVNGSPKEIETAEELLHTKNHHRKTA